MHFNISNLIMRGLMASAKTMATINGQMISIALKTPKKKKINTTVVIIGSKISNFNKKLRNKPKPLSSLVIPNQWLSSKSKTYQDKCYNPIYFLRDSHRRNLVITINNKIVI